MARLKHQDAGLLLWEAIHEGLRKDVGSHYEKEEAVAFEIDGEGCRKGSTQDDQSIGDKFQQKGRIKNSDMEQRSLRKSTVCLC